MTRRARVVSPGPWRDGSALEAYPDAVQVERCAFVVMEGPGGRAYGVDLNGRLHVMTGDQLEALAELMIAGLETDGPPEGQPLAPWERRH